jgi:hypothetical protein
MFSWIGSTCGLKIPLTIAMAKVANGISIQNGPVKRAGEG